MRHLLYTEWASLKSLLKFQPLDAVRDYYGVKIAFYFAWLGFYNMALILPSIVGVATMIYGLATLKDDITNQKTCNDHESSSAIDLCPCL